MRLLEEKGSVRFMKVEFPDLRTSPSLWWGPENPIHLTSMDLNSRLYEADCQIQAVSPDEVVLNCEQEMLAVPRLG